MIGMEEIIIIWEKAPQIIVLFALCAALGIWLLLDP
jgi:hypothetical protein